MRVTTEQLRRVISEELLGRDALYDIESYNLLEFAREYAKLGGAVQEQLDTILDGDTDSFGRKTNPNAIDLIEERLGGMNEEIDTAIEAYKEWMNGHGGDDDADDQGDDR